MKKMTAKQSKAIAWLKVHPMMLKFEESMDEILQGGQWSKRKQPSCAYQASKIVRAQAKRAMRRAKR